MELVTEILNTAWEYAKPALKAIFGNYNIWIPVGLAWVAGFFAKLRLNVRNITRQADRDLYVYRANFLVAVAAYIAFNFNETGVIQYAISAGVVAVLLPVTWFWYKRLKGL